MDSGKKLPETTAPGPIVDPLSGGGFVWRLLLPFAVAIAVRWYRLDHLEPFVDEGANILTSLDARIRDVFHPLEQGRPLLEWLFRPAPWLPGDLLWASRSMTALAGLATMASLAYTLAKLAGRQAALWGLWLWALLPVAVWHERLALQDPFVTAGLGISLACLFAGQSAGKYRTIAWLAAGVAFGTTFLLKISATFALAWLAIFYFGLRRQQSASWWDRRLLWLALGMVVPIACLGPGLAKLGTGLGDYHVMPSASGWLAGYASRFDTWTSWYLEYDGWPLLVLLATASFAILRLPANRVMVCSLIGGWLAMLVVSPFFYNMAYSRYTLPDHLPLVLAFAVVLASTQGARLRKVVVLAGAVALFRFGMVDVSIVSDPATASVPAADIEQYVTGPWSGRGTRAVRNYLTGYADLHRVSCLVLTHRGLRPGCYALMLAEWSDPRVAVMPFTIYEREELAATLPSLRQVAKGRAVAFFLLTEGSLYPPHPWLGQPGTGTELAATIDRGDGENFKLFRVTP
ncbi:MAG TPA: glycosyltransferase family 39 protein [Candidatus Didemnitutus sp.]|nr:glycosyltransferase family 39 protein [Candidatus Didemnitutus sp.]